MKSRPEPLTTSERAEIAAMMESPGWRIAKEKVWSADLETYRDACTKSQANIRFLQGMFQGYQWAIRKIEHLAHPDTETPDLYFPKETDLRSRRSGSLM